MSSALMETDGPEIVFFDLETTYQFHKRERIVILEFASILVCPQRLIKLQSYSTLVRPLEYPFLHEIQRANGITSDALNSAPTFEEVADKIYDILHGKIWAGHNIEKFDHFHIQQAFKEIGRLPPKQKDMIDTLVLLKAEFKETAGDSILEMGMANLATYFGLGKQTHRALDDVRMNLEVVRSCATKLFLESRLPHIFKPVENDSPFNMGPLTNLIGSGYDEFLEPKEVSTNLIRVEPRKLLHNNVLLQLRCSRLKIIYDAQKICLGPTGQPQFDIIVKPSTRLCEVLNCCDELARNEIVKLRSKFEWEHVLLEKFNFSAIRLYIQDIDSMEIYEEASLQLQKLSIRGAEAHDELASLLARDMFVDAFFDLYIHEDNQRACIRLVAKKLIIHSK